MGVKVTLREVGAVTAGLERVATEWVRRTAADVETFTKQVTPIDTGTLRRSIHTEMTGPLEATVGTDVEYAEIVHDGTATKPGRPYLIWGGTAAMPRAEERLRALLRRVGR